MMHRLRIPILIVLIMVFLPLAAAEVTVFKGDSIVVQDANWTLTWGQDYTFNASGSIMYPDTFHLRMEDGDDRNISVTSDTPAWLNTTLWEYDFDGFADGDELIRLEVEADPDSTVDMTFASLPAPEGGTYKVEADGVRIEEIASGGELSWSYSDWSTKNVTVTYREDSDDHTGTGPSTPAPPEHCWRSMETAFGRDDPATGITRVDINTMDSVSGPCMNISSVQEIPGHISVPENVYRYYTVELDAFTSDDIADATLTFAVDAVFAEQYNDIVVSRYTGTDWMGLPTDRIDTTGDIWLYEATANGFSYLAVQGVDEEEPGEPEDPADEGDEPDDSDPAEPADPADSGPAEPAFDESSELETPEEYDGLEALWDRIQVPERAPIMAGAILLMFIIMIAGVYGYRTMSGSSPSKSKEDVYKEIKELERAVMGLIDKKGAPHQDYVEGKLDSASAAIEQERMDDAQRTLQELRDHLEQD